MLILATSDLHGNISFYRSLVRLAQSHRPDAIVLAGDLSGGSASPEAEAERLLHILSSIRAPVYFLMGNDDEIDWAGLPHTMRPLNQRKYPLGAWSVIGYQYTPPFVGGIFEKTEPEIKADLESMKDAMDQLTVFVTHGPARGTLDVTHTGANVGSTAIADFVQKHPFYVHIHGHIHEAHGRAGRIFNVAAPASKKALLLNLKDLTTKGLPL